MGRFFRAGADEFFLVNVSDVRPVPLSTDCAMRLVWDAAACADRSDSENREAFLKQWSQRQFGPKVATRVAGLYSQYFAIPYQRPAIRQGDNALASRLYNLDAAAATLMASNQPLTKAVLDEVREAKEFAQTNRAYVAALVRRAESLTRDIPRERRPFYQAHVLTPAQLHLHLLEMLEERSDSFAAYARGENQSAISHLETAVRSSEALFASLHQAEYGKWARWYIGERFVGLEAARDRLRHSLALLRGEPAPPIRATRGYADLYRYQERFQQNFPRLYPPNSSSAY